MPDAVAEQERRYMRARARRGLGEFPWCGTHATRDEIDAQRDQLEREHSDHPELKRLYDECQTATFAAFKYVALPR